jgi:hypothetical protein
MASSLDVLVNNELSHTDLITGSSGPTPGGSHRRKILLFIAVDDVKTLFCITLVIYIILDNILFFWLVYCFVIRLSGYSAIWLFGGYRFFVK